MHLTPFLTFRLKGNGTSTDLRIVCKNMSANHEDWWYTERINLSNADWQEFTLDLRTLQAFSWYTNTDDHNQCEGIVRLSFGVSTGNAVSGTFYLDDIKMTGEILPAPDFAQTVILRKNDAFPDSPTDGTEIYRGSDETCTDPSAVVGQLYYYAAFAADDRDNWSAPAPSAQWRSDDMSEGFASPLNNTPAPQKFLRNGHVFIQRGNTTYSLLGGKVE